MLLTSVCRPLGEAHGDAPSVGYELLYGQVTRAQGAFSPRATHIHFSLEYIAENLDAPTTVLQYPSRRELRRELDRGYDVIGVSFVLATLHRLRELVALIRKVSPRSRIVLGGYGTVLPDEQLAPLGDAICREEGVAFLRAYLGEPPLPMPYRHPLTVSRLRVFGLPVSRTGMVFAGLGCPNGCDFCCTSHFFRRRHIRLLPTGRDIYRVVERYLDMDPNLSIVILDEDFLLNRRRAMEFRQCVMKSERTVSVFVFSSVRAISQYTIQEILEMGIDGFWIGYEGRRAGFAKQKGRPVDELFWELRDHGVTVLTSMIVGLPYQDEATIAEELRDLIALRPALAQFLIYGPILGTPLYDAVQDAGTLREPFASDLTAYAHDACGFRSMIAHPKMSPGAIEAAQRRCFRADFEQLGPSILRVVDTWLRGYLKLRDRPEPALRRKAERFAREIRRAYPLFLAGRWFGPTTSARRWAGYLQRQVDAALGPVGLGPRLAQGVVAAAAAWTALQLRLGIGQHPKLVRHTYRMPAEGLVPRAWRRLGGHQDGPHRVWAELRAERTIWVHVSGRLQGTGAERLSRHLADALDRGRERLVLDLRQVAELEEAAWADLVQRLRSYRDRVRVALPDCDLTPDLAAALPVY